MTSEPYTISKRTKIIVGTLLVVLIVAGAGTLQYMNRAHAPEGPVTVTDIDGLPEGATATVEERLNADRFNTTPRPALERALPTGTDSPAVHQRMLEKRNALVVALTDNPARMGQWLELGILHKQVGDYEGARIYFAYVVEVNPENIAAQWNLANLYAYYLKDTAKAESGFRKVIALDATYIPGYAELFAVVKLRSSTDAIGVLQSGMTKNPGDTDLAVLLAHHYREMKDPSTKAAYDEAIMRAQKAGNTELVTSLQMERAAL